MSEMAQISIEDNPELLTEYGRAFMLINIVDLLLEEVIIFRGRVNLVETEVRKKLMKGKMLGQKIELSSSLLEPDVLIKLKLLKDKRNLLAHSFVGEEVNLADTKEKTEKYVIGVGEEKQSLTLDFMSEIIRLAQSLCIELRKALVKGTNYKAGTAT